VHGTGCTVHEKRHLPPGVASTLRRAKSKALALHYRAESPAISSTGQRPVETGISQQPALKGRNPAIDSMMPRRGGRYITVCKRSAAYGCGVHLHSKSRRDVIIPPLRGLRGESASTPRVTPPASPAVMHLPPLRGYDSRPPLSTGRCPVLMSCGLSALLPPGVETQCIASLQDAVRHVSTRNRKFL
jgi:hypothetical protein